jgi:hypothetical protein
MKRNSKAKRLNSRSPVRLWTVVTVVDGHISCSVHRSEYQAYREAVSRFIYTEPDSIYKCHALGGLLEAAARRGDFQSVRQYITAHACKVYLMQLAEHDVSN